jgi:hypothetical protein
MDLQKLTELAASLPDSVRAKAQALVTRMGEKIEGIGDKPVEWRPSTAKLMQAVSDRSKAPKGALPGSIIVGEEILDQPARVIVLRSWDARQYWSPDQNEAKMLCSSPDAELGYMGYECRKCPHSKFDEETKKTECNKIKTMMVLKADLSDIFLINFAKTNYKVGTDWQMMMKKAGVAPYRRIYGLRSETSKQYKNVETIAIETYEGDKRDTPTEFLAFVTEMFNQVGADRKAHVDEFHKIVLSRKQDPAMLSNSGSADSEVVMVGTDVKDDETPAEQVEKKESSAAKKYKI